MFNKVETLEELDKLLEAEPKNRQNAIMADFCVINKINYYALPIELKYYLLQVFSVRVSRNTKTLAQRRLYSRLQKQYFKEIEILSKIFFEQHKTIKVDKSKEFKVTFDKNESGIT